MPAPAPDTPTIGVLPTLGLAFAAMACAWAWTVWDCLRHRHYLTPLRWYIAHAPEPPARGAWDIRELNGLYPPPGCATVPVPLRLRDPEPITPRRLFSLDETWRHPAGVYPARLVGWCEDHSAGETAIRWVFASRVNRPGGGAARLEFVTTTRIAPRNRMGQLLQACRLPLPTSEAEAARLDPDALLAVECLVRVRRRRHLLRPDTEEVCEVLPCRSRGPSATVRG